MLKPIAAARGLRKALITIEFHDFCGVTPAIGRAIADLSGELAPKQLQLLHELLPDAARFGTLVLPYDRNPL
jgi:hypothetical protein